MVTTRTWLTPETPRPVHSRQTFISQNVACLSEIDEVLNDTFHLRGEPSLKVTANLSTTNEDLSPVIDLAERSLYREKPD